jgi:hypothetical protein
MFLDRSKWATTRRAGRAATRLGVVTSLAIFSASAAGCGGSGSTSSEHAATPWVVAVPAIRPLSLAESLNIIRSDRGSGPSSLYVAQASAAVFAVGQDRLNTAHPEWKALLRKVCGPTGLLSEALAEGWDVTVTGFVDTTGPMGAGTLNDRLQAARAKRAGAELVSECRIPANRVKTRKGGVGGPGAHGRRITVTYTREPLKP